jgi:hypothetical protein
MAVSWSVLAEVVAGEILAVGLADRADEGVADLGRSPTCAAIGFPAPKSDDRHQQGRLADQRLASQSRKRAAVPWGHRHAS